MLAGSIICSGVALAVSILEDLMSTSLSSLNSLLCSYRVQGRCTTNHSYEGLAILCTRVVMSQIVDGVSCVTFTRKLICWTELLRTESVQGGQAPLENQANVPPPKYVFARRNCWPGYLPKPKRLARDSISTCDCHPSDSGLQSPRTGLLMSSISPLQKASKAYVCYTNQKHLAKGV